MPQNSDLIVFLYTQDLEGTQKFYEEVLGLKCTVDQIEHKAFRISENSFVGFSYRPNITFTQPRGICISIVSDYVDEWYEELLNKGIQIEKSPSIDPKTNIYNFFFRDNNNYIIEIQKFLDSNWKSK